MAAATCPLGSGSTATGQRPGQHNCLTVDLTTQRHLPELACLEYEAALPVTATYATKAVQPNGAVLPGFVRGICSSFSVEVTVCVQPPVCTAPEMLHLSCAAGAHNVKFTEMLQLSFGFSTGVFSEHSGRLLAASPMFQSSQVRLPLTCTASRFDSCCQTAARAQAGGGVCDCWLCCKYKITAPHIRSEIYHAYSQTKQGPGANAALCTCQGSYLPHLSVV